jgi:glutathione S-transferase
MRFGRWRERDMIELIQFPCSPFCIVQRRILEFSGAPFKITNVPNGDRSLIWKLSKERYYQVPLLRDGRTVIFETDENSQIIAKYLENKLRLGLFPEQWRGVQTLLWRYIENDIEGFTFRLNDIFWEENVPRSDRLRFVRHKERKFGHGCLARWREEQPQLLEQLTQNLVPFEQMLMNRPFLLDQRPLFVDFDLYGMLANFLFSGHYELPPVHAGLRRWFEVMAKNKLEDYQSEKLRS